MKTVKVINDDRDFEDTLLALRAAYEAGYAFRVNIKEDFKDWDEFVKSLRTVYPKAFH